MPIMKRASVRCAILAVTLAQVLVLFNVQTAIAVCTYFKEAVIVLVLLVITLTKTLPLALVAMLVVLCAQVRCLHSA
jgi:hypothetical protein